MNQDAAFISLKWRGENLASKSKWKLSFEEIAANTADIREVIRSRLEAFGMVVFTDVPIEGKSDVQVAELLSKSSFRIGCPVSQSAKLDFLGYVTNRGKDISDHSHRGYESAAELPFHSDRCDLLSLLCVRQAPIGGETRIVSAYEAYCTLSRVAPKFAEVLCRPVPIDLRDTISGAQWALMPIFSFEKGTFVARYVRRFIEASQRFNDAPRLTGEQHAAFDTLDSILNEPGMSLDLRLKPGDWLLVDNHRLFHARTEFQDAPDPTQARLLLRTWLCWNDSPELPLSFVPTYGRIEAGSYRGGVWSKENPLSSMPLDIDTARSSLQARLF